jgi:hypothetical protein
MDTLGIIRQIESDPGLRAQLRAVLLGDEVLGLPGQVAQLIEVQRQMQAVLEAMVERMDRMEARQDRMETDVGVLKGSDLERRVRNASTIASRSLAPPSSANGSPTPDTAMGPPAGPHPPSPSRRACA